MVDPAENQYTGPTTAYTGSKETSHNDGAQTQEPAKIYALVKHLVDDLALLLRKELALSASEVSHTVKDTKKGMAGLVSGAVVLNSGFLFLLAAATIGLARIMEPWLAALIVGVIATIVGLVMVQSGKKKLELSNLKPERAMEEHRKDRESVRGVTS